VTGPNPTPGKPRRTGDERPRDEFGRPLPWGSESRIALEDYDSFSIEQNMELAVEAFNRSTFFTAHEAWEAAWRQARNTPDEEFLKGLAQLGAGYTHMQRGNAHGAKTLLTRARARLAPHRLSHRGLDLDALCDALRRHIEAFAEDEAAGRPPRKVDPPRL
jgi:uncharacterized protein